MNIGPVEEAMERYVSERMAKGREAAGRRFLSYAHLRFSGGDLSEFLKKTSGLSRYYGDYLKVMMNPLKGPELAFLASAIIVLASGLVMMRDPDLRLMGIFVFSGAVVNGWTVLSTIARKWCDLDVLRAIYGELHQLAQEELRTRP